MHTLELLHKNKKEKSKYTQRETVSQTTRHDETGTSADEDEDHRKIRAEAASSVLSSFFLLHLVDDVQKNTDAADAVVIGNDMMCH